MKNQELMMDKLNTNEILTLKWKGFPSSKIAKTGLVVFDKLYDMEPEGGWDISGFRYSHINEANAWNFNLMDDLAES